MSASGASGVAGSSAESVNISSMSCEAEAVSGASAFSEPPSGLSASSAGSDSAFSDDLIRGVGNKKIVKEITVKKNVQFMTAKADLTADAKNIIAAVAGALKSRPKTKCTVEGHTFATELHPGAQGKQFKVESKEYKELRKRMTKLSLLRAQNVKKELIKKGVNKKNVRAVGMGDKRPLMKGDKWDEEGSKRVVFLTNAKKGMGARYGGRGKGKKGGRKGAMKGKAAAAKGKAAAAKGARGGKGGRFAGKGKGAAIASKSSAGKKASVSSAGKKSAIKGSKIMTAKRMKDEIKKISGSGSSSASGSDSGVPSSGSKSSSVPSSS